MCISVSLFVLVSTLYTYSRFDQFLFFFFWSRKKSFNTKGLGGVILLLTNDLLGGRSPPHFPKFQKFFEFFPALPLGKKTPLVRSFSLNFSTFVFLFSYFCFRKILFVQCLFNFLKNWFLNVKRSL